MTWLEHLLKNTFIPLLLLSLTAGISGCKKNDDEQSDNDNAYVKEPAWPVLEEENSLSRFFFPDFNYDPSLQPKDDSFTVYFETFKPQSNIEPDEDAIDQTTNDLLFEETVWDDAQIQWVTNSNILSSAQSPFQKVRDYRILTEGNLQPKVIGKNLPIYEAIDDNETIDGNENIFTQHLATEYIWDIGNFDDADDEDLSGQEIQDYETSEDGYTLLPNASIWSDVDGTDSTFSDGATLYSASYSINNNIYVVEAVDDGNEEFSLTAAGITVSSATTLAELISEYQEPVRLEFKFTTDFLNHQTIYIGFDSATQTAHLATTSGAATADASVDYSVDATALTIEIDTQALDATTLEILTLEAFFNPIIVGPDNGSFYAGKHYIATTKDNREKLARIFFFNTIAAGNIQNTFEAWRDDKYQNPP